MEDDGVTVIVPVWNRRNLVAPLLRNLAAQQLEPAEILVVDNGSTDGAAEAAAAGGARVIRMGRNAGFAAAVNRGIRESETAWVAVLNNDVELAPAYLRELRSAAAESDSWFATGKIYAAGQSIILDGSFDLVCRGATARRAGHGEADGPEFAARRPIYSAPWTAALFRTELFAKVGLLEESFESYLEDVDFGIRCARAGYAGLYVPEAVAWHRGSATLGRWHPETVRLLARNQLLIAARHLPVRCAWAVIVAQLLWGGIAVRNRAFWPCFWGKAEALCRFRSVRSTYYSSRGEKVLLDWLRENEMTLRQERSLYWRLYFLLTPGGAE